MCNSAHISGMHGAIVFRARVLKIEFSLYGWFERKENGLMGGMHFLWGPLLIFIFLRINATKFKSLWVEEFRILSRNFHGFTMSCSSKAFRVASLALAQLGSSLQLSKVWIEEVFHWNSKISVIFFCYLVSSIKFLLVYSKKEEVKTLVHFHEKCINIISLIYAPANYVKAQWQNLK